MTAEGAKIAMFLIASRAGIHWAGGTFDAQKS